MRCWLGVLNPRPYGSCKVLGIIKPTSWAYRVNHLGDATKVFCTKDSKRHNMIFSI